MEVLHAGQLFFQLLFEHCMLVKISMSPEKKRHLFSFEKSHIMVTEDKFMDSKGRSLN